jgi:hypothetical protein
VEVTSLHEGLVKAELTLRNVSIEFGGQRSVFDLQSDNETMPFMMNAIKDLRTKMLLSARGEEQIVPAIV